MNRLVLTCLKLLRIFIVRGKKNRGAVDIFENIEFPVSPETENSHWLKGGKSVITLTTADHDCLQARLAVRSSCHCCVLRWIDNLLERSLERFANVSSLKDEQKEAVRHLLCSNDVVGILPTGAGCYGETNARRWECCCSYCSSQKKWTYSLEAALTGFVRVVQDSLANHLAGTTFASLKTCEANVTLF